MAIQIRKVSETDTAITLGWDPVPGADGYRFYSAGVLRSKTMDPRRKTVKFSKGQEPYKVEAVVLSGVDSGTYPAQSPPPPPPPPALNLAPQTYNKGSNGQNARFCVQGLPRMNDPGHPWFGRLYDDRASYDDNGRCWGGRSEQFIEGLRPSDQMDGRGPCDPYDGMPPWPAKSYEV